MTENMREGKRKCGGLSSMVSWLLTTKEDATHTPLTENTKMQVVTDYFLPKCRPKMTSFDNFLEKKLETGVETFALANTSGE